MHPTAPEHASSKAPTTMPKKHVAFRRPRIEDGPAIWKLVEDTPGLDSNSPYYYTLWFRDFADGSLLATVDGRTVGFLTGYRRPEEPDTYFVWQTAVSPRHGIPFLGVKLFEQAVEQQVARGARHVEATVSAENKAIIMVLKKIAKKYGATIETGVLFPGSLLSSASPDGAVATDDAHHDEILYRIGPLPHR
ncbi:diaminobutyrate acetyltransferase [Streptomyces sp. NPDC048057]|uniref:diaminobutyrate acetyltransferase n=1 Tax=Streptomyces sp. NPDC048057 TaxID=3155628 RepID=UPI0033CA1FE2